MRFILFVLCLSLLFSCGKKSSKNALVLPSAEFEKKVRENLRKMEAKQEINEEGHVELIRIYNTLDGQGSHSSAGQEFLRFYKSYYLPSSLEMLYMESNASGGMYSPKYNVCIGGIPNENSIYVLE